MVNYINFRLLHHRSAFHSQFRTTSNRCLNNIKPTVNTSISMMFIERYFSVLRSVKEVKTFVFDESARN